MHKVAYQLVVDFNQNNLKTLSQEILHFAKRLLVICEDEQNFIENLNRIVDAEHTYPFICREIIDEHEKLKNCIDQDLSLDSWKPDSTSGNYAENIRPLSDAASFVKLLLTSSLYLLKDIVDDRIGLNALNVPDFTLLNPEKEMETASYKKDFKKFCFQMNYYNARSEIYVNTLSDLKSRLSQSIELHSEDVLKSDPNRRVLENVTDNFVTNVAARCYRDIYNFLSQFNDSNYPYESLPIVYQYQNTSQISRIAGFNTDESYKQWVNSLTEVKGDKARSNGFSILQLSCWLQERNLMPVIGHEIAHRVLRNVGSRTLLPQLLAMSKRLGNLGRFIRGISGVYRPIVRQNGIREHHKLELELMCDLLAATRFGYSFLYVWLLKGFYSHTYSAYLYDEYGRLDKDLIEASSLKPVNDSEAEIFHRYIIGKSIIFWLKVMGTEQDGDSQGLAESVNEYLDILLISTYSKTRVAIAMSVAESIRKLIIQWNSKKPLSILRRDMNPAESYDQSHETYFWMKVQSMSKPLVDHLNQMVLSPLTSEINKFNDGKPKFKNRSMLKALKQSSGLSSNPEHIDISAVSDIQWRIEWRLALLRSLHFQAKEGNAEKTKVTDSTTDFQRKILAAQRSSKLSLRLGIEDYVYNVRNILTMLSAIIMSDSNMGPLYLNAFGNFWLNDDLGLRKELIDALSASDSEKKHINTRLNPLNTLDDHNPFRLKVRNTSLKNPITVLKILNRSLHTFKNTQEGKNKNFAALTNKLLECLENYIAQAIHSRSESWTSQTLLDTFNSYNVTSNRGVYEQRQTVYRRV